MIALILFSWVILPPVLQSKKWACCRFFICIELIILACLTSKGKQVAMLPLLYSLQVDLFGLLHVKGKAIPPPDFLLYLLRTMKRLV